MAQFAAGLQVFLNAQVGMARIVFSDPLSGQVVADVALTPSVLKELALLARKFAKQYEAEVAPIVLPAISWEKMGIAQEDW